jgi:hypothetical protein
LLLFFFCIGGDGNPWNALPGETDEIAFLNNVDLLRLESKISLLSGAEYTPDDDDKRPYIKFLEDPSTTIKEGGRHDAVKILGCSYFYRYKDGWKDFTNDQRHDKLQEWNQQRCIPPLPNKEFDEIWK